MGILTNQNNNTSKMSLEKSRHKMKMMKLLLNVCLRCVRSMQHLSIEDLYIPNVYQETQTIIADWSIIYIYTEVWIANTHFSFLLTFLSIICLVFPQQWHVAYETHSYEPWTGIFELQKP